jgi:hypothetical protein
MIRPPSRERDTLSIYLIFGALIGDKDRRRASQKPSDLAKANSLLFFRVNSYPRGSPSDLSIKLTSLVARSVFGLYTVQLLDGVIVCADQNVQSSIARMIELVAPTR